MLTAESALRKDRTTAGDLQHRHFATIARIIETDMRAGFDQYERGAVARVFADALARTNPRFDRTRFLRACGVEE